MRKADRRPMFYDTYGNEILPGDYIVIEKNYNSQHFNNREAVVMWDFVNGIYTFKFIDGEGRSNNNFYGIHQFKRVKPKPKHLNYADKND